MAKSPSNELCKKGAINANDIDIAQNLYLNPINISSYLQNEFAKISIRFI